MVNVLRILFLLACINGIFGIYFEDQFPANTGFAKREDETDPFTVTLGDRTNCGPGDTPPDNRHDTTLRVNNLIAAMINMGYDAYIVPSADEHQDEYVAESDKRREYISGFTGSAGTAVILSNGTRALWSDGRFFLQGDEELDCQWLFMKDGESGVPTIAEWLINIIPGGVASVDARLVGSDTWIETEAELNANGIELLVDEVTDGNDLLDLVWMNDGRPGIINNIIYVHEIMYAGESWQDKIVRVMTEVENYGAQAFVLTALDEIAWIMNLRGFDIPYNPVFKCYVIIDGISRSPPLVTMYIGGNLTAGAESQLNVGNCVTEDPCVSIAPYNDISAGILALNARIDIHQIMISGSFSTSPGSSYYIYDLVTASKRIVKSSPILFMKAKKNEVEQNGMRNAHIKDATAVTSFLAFIDDQITSGAEWTEITAQDKLAEYRYAELENMGLSFETISGFGANAAIIHYKATEETNTMITTDNVYLLDSGGQYKDGSTDITRTLHFGTPTANHIEAYTRVLMGVIDFANIAIPEGTGKEYTDVLARRALFDVGLDYRHGTSHGVGMFLFVHESSDSVYELGFCGSDEPGYYEDGHFGIRIENVIMVVNASTTYDFNPVSYTFETLTLVPFEKKLIDTSLLNEHQCQFLSDFNNKIQTIMGPILQDKDLDAYNYMMDKTDISC